MMMASVRPRKGIALGARAAWPGGPDVVRAMYDPHKRAAGN